MAGAYPEQRWGHSSGTTVLEFLGLEEQARYLETALESEIIDKLQKFLLELGKGYLFEARQKRFTCDEENFYLTKTRSVTRRSRKSFGRDVNTIHQLGKYKKKPRWSMQDRRSFRMIMNKSAIGVEESHKEQKIMRFSYHLKSYKRMERISVI